MIRSIVVHDIPADSVAAMERWYYREHAPEIARRYGPWLARHESFVPVPPPPEAAGFGVFDWRVTDCWWREVPEPGAKGALSFTPPPVWPQVATCFIPAQPTDDFLGSGMLPAEGACFRWHALQRYPDGVSAEEGERWFLETHAPELCRLPGLRRSSAPGSSRTTSGCRASGARRRHRRRCSTSGTACRSSGSRR